MSGPFDLPIEEKRAGAEAFKKAHEKRPPAQPITNKHTEQEQKMTVAKMNANITKAYKYLVCAYGDSLQAGAEKKTA